MARIQAWRRRYGERLEGWLQALGQMEALISLGTLCHCKAVWCFPQISQSERPFLAAKDIRHPLIGEDKAVGNDFDLCQSICIITGSNMSGKTTFLRGLIPALTARGVRVAAIKHDAHGFEMDHENTDTWHLRRVGAESAAILGPDSWAVLGRGERTFEDICRTLPKVDLILAEGFKYSPLPKLEIHRKAAGHPLIVQDETLLTVLTDEPLEVEAPQMSLTDFETCADLLCRQFDLPEKKS